MLKMHWTDSKKGGPACGRGQRVSDNVYAVTCDTCRGREDYHDAWREAEAKRYEAFMAQEPRQFREPWRDGNIVCRECNGELFRIGDRTCYGHYENYHCANCGHIEERLTETGMSF